LYFLVPAHATHSEGGASLVIGDRVARVESDPPGVRATIRLLRRRPETGGSGKRTTGLIVNTINISLL
jgi:hypothetical protein